MKNTIWILWLAVFLFPLQLRAQIQVTPLESYDFALGDSEADEFLFHDKNLGTGGGTQPAGAGGFAQFRIHLFKGAGSETDLRIQIFRHQKQNSISFALLLERIELIFSSGSGALVKKIILDEKLGPDGLFIIGDSNDGYFEHVMKLKGLSAARRLQIRIFGNYE